MFRSIDITSLEEKLHSILGSISFFLPELFLMACLILLLVGGLIFRAHRKLYIALSLGGLLITLVLLVLQWQEAKVSGPVPLFSGMLLLDSSSIFFKGIFCVAGLVTVLFSAGYRFKETRLSRLSEFYVLFFGLLAGSFLMTMGVNLLFLYLSIELVSLTSYMLTHFNFGKKSTEASIKYLLFGGISTGTMLYGMSLLYGFTGTLTITSPDFAAGLTTIDQVPLMLAGFLTVGGFLFKISTVPFHLWAPDVYEGAPTPVVAFFSVVPKLAGVVILLRFLYALSPPDAAGERMMQDSWRFILSVVAMASMVIGNFSALWQNNAKRMLAYSSIAHGGFLLVGVVAFSHFGLHSIMFYATIYLLMNFGAFLLIDMIASKTGTEQISQYAGLGRHYPVLAVAAVIVMIALTGLPPTAGFTAKLLIFSSLWDTYQAGSQPVVLLLFIVGLLNTVIALFYYLKIPYYLFFREVSTEGNAFEKITVREGILVAGLTIPLLILFFKSDWLMRLITPITFIF